MCGSDVFLGVLAVFFPPVAVWIKVGVCTADSVINLALCCLGYVPGLLHAWYIILKYPEPDYSGATYEPIPSDAAPSRDLENGQTRYYYVSREHAQHPSHRSYGTVQSSPLPSQLAAEQRRSDESSGSSSRPHDHSREPPTYAEAVKGDHKIQT